MLKERHYSSKIFNICLLSSCKNGAKTWIFRAKTAVFMMQKGNIRTINLSVLSEKWPSNIFQPLRFSSAKCIKLYKSTP